jgi:hypothetical protein
MEERKEKVSKKERSPEQKKLTNFFFKPYSFILEKRNSGMVSKGSIAGYAVLLGGLGLGGYVLIKNLPSISDSIGQWAASLNPFKPASTSYSYQGGVLTGNQGDVPKNTDGTPVVNTITEGIRLSDGTYVYHTFPAGTTESETDAWFIANYPGQLQYNVKNQAGAAAAEAAQNTNSGSSGGGVRGTASNPISVVSSQVSYSNNTSGTNYLGSGINITLQNSTQAQTTQGKAIDAAIIRAVANAAAGNLAVLGHY